MDGPLPPGSFVGYVFIETSDLDRSVAFYRDVLGFDAAFIQPGVCAFVSLHGSRPQLAIYQSDGKRKAGDHPLLAIEVTDLDESASRLRAAGVDVDPARDVPGGRIAIFHDPDGNRLELHESGASR